MGKGLASFAVGFGTGYLNASRQKEIDDERKQDRANRQIEFDARMDDVNRAKQERSAIVDAVKPAAVNESAATLDMGDGPKVYDDAGVANSDMRQARTMGLSDVQAPQQTIAVNGQSFATRPEADAAAAAYNAPEATDKRVGLAMAKSGNVLGAKQYEAASRQSQTGAMALADQLYKRQLGEAMQAGHEGIANWISKSGGDGLKDHQLTVIPSADGKMVTYGKVGEDGTVTPLPRLTFPNNQDGAVMAAHLLDKTLTPDQRYSHMVTEQKTAAAATLKLQELDLKRRQLEEVAIPNAETKQQLADVKTQMADLKGQGASDKVSREERLRYTTLFTDAGRRAAEAQKALTALQKDPLYSMAKEGSPQFVEMQGLRDAIASHQEERGIYQKLLAGSQSGDAPAPAPAAAPGPAPASSPGLGNTSSTTIPKAVQTARDGDSLSILNGELAKAQQRAAQGDTRAAGDVEAIQREIAVVSKKAGRAAPAPGLANVKAAVSGAKTPPNDYSQLWK
ncbi:hypothetical protein RD110_15545 [Rhodoferax koreense]|uniref:Uncharacterized protein n=1 Tax=Rhodoferax koreensis TaxID=1842727 RepID=A0A1P8JXF8_9BURK|nr:hypothetical protein [Rhodoferax koreense]APW38436.1 hypothetical protein RD110_15545 [Rhodoferax koreense]